MRGMDSEERVMRALGILYQAQVIVNFIQSETNGQYDKQGIDILVFIDWDLCVPLQVKSSETGVQEHVEIQYSQIPVVLVEDSLTEEMLAVRLKGILGLDADFLQPYVDAFGGPEATSQIIHEEAAPLLAEANSG